MDPDSIGIKLRFLDVNSPDSAVNHLTAVDNDKNCVCVGNCKTSAISDYFCKFMQVCSKQNP